MSRVLPVRWVAAVGLTATLTLSAVVLGEPPDKLLDQAVKEKQGLDSKQDVRAAAELLTQADRLAEQRKFDDAIGLYERAYRLDPGNPDSYAKLLIAKRLAGRISESEKEALDLIEDGRAMKIEDTLRVVRLDILQARDAVRRHDTGLAGLKVDHARGALSRLPKDVDVAIYRKELDRLNVAAHGKPAKAKPAADAGQPRPSGDALHLSDTGQPPASGETHDPRGDVEGPSAQFGHLMREEQIYEPDEDLQDYFGTWEKGTQRKYAAEMDRAIRASRAEWYFDAQSDGVTPRADMAYPEDWPQRTARRARYADGEIYRGPVTKDKDGREVYTAIYDLGDLVHPVPNFYGWNPNSLERLGGLLDRQALRDRSMIFGGYADDLAAGLPLLPFFGGVDNWAISPRSDPRELDRVLRTIDAFVGK